LLGLTLFGESYMSLVQKRLEDKFSVCTMDPPQMLRGWRTRGIYACFLSHYKMEAASDARYMHDMLRKMLKAPVFLDSSTLSDLRNLITEGVHKSDTLVLLATKGVLSRPWCLLELLETVRNGIPVVLVRMANAGFEFEKAQKFISNLEVEMAMVNSSGLDLLYEHVGRDLGELKDAVLGLLKENERLSHRGSEEGGRDPLLFDAHAGDAAMVATMKDVIEQMAQMTKRNLQWDNQSQTRPRVTSGKGMTVARKASIHSPGGAVSQGNPAKADYAMFICCALDDALKHARVLRSQLAIKAARPCLIGGGAEGTAHVDDCEMVVVLLTKQLLSNNDALLELWTALEHQKPVVTVHLTGSGYEYSHAAAVYANLGPSLEAAKPGAPEALARKLPAGVTVAEVGKKLHASLTAIIAISWSPLASNNQQDAVVDSIFARMPKRGRFELKGAISLVVAGANGRTIRVDHGQLPNMSV